MFDWVLSTPLLPMSGKSAYKLKRSHSQVYVEKVSEILKHEKIPKNS